VRSSCLLGLKFLVPIDNVKKLKRGLFLFLFSWRVSIDFMWACVFKRILCGGVEDSSVAIF
jgi:hypothetical protein